MARPFISLLSDFGARDPSAGIMRGVILGICPEANVVDISHEVAKFHVRDGALLLWCALPYLPVGAHVAVVDPGVGTERRPLALRTARGDLLVGPDNGLLLPVAEQRLGGLVEARELTAPAYRLVPVSSSFHGRDVFAPAAAHLARGVPFESLGPLLDGSDLVRLEWPAPTLVGERLRTAIVYVDTFGNVKLGALATDLAAACGGDLAPGTPLVVSWSAGGAARPVTRRVRWAATFGQVAPGKALLYEDSYGRLCLALNQASAAERLGLTEEQVLTIRRA
jgi:S-adenosyl-L-methionine hydrolase (adenosine-forming)